MVSTEQLSDEESVKLGRDASKVFTPATPVADVELFSGRVSQIHKVFDAINQPGQHAVLYGDRGVGKTSLANVLSMLISVNKQQAMPTSKVNCDATDTFQSVWRKALSELTIRYQKAGMGFTSEPAIEIRKLADSLAADATPNDVRVLLGQYQIPILVVFDEFDRLPLKAARVFTDCIKSLSDYSVNTTVVIVGVASTIDQLVKDHASIERALVQIPMPRMQADELKQIVTKGAKKLALEFNDDAADQIVQLSQGLPHYTHLVALHSVRAAAGRHSRIINSTDVGSGLKLSVENAQHTIKDQFHRATLSSHRSALFEQVLLACALAKKDSMSCFRAADVVDPLHAIMGKNYQIPAFARHLSEFCATSRSKVLEQLGQTRRWRYRFTNPLLEPYIVMRGLASNQVSSSTLAALAEKSSEVQ